MLFTAGEYLQGIILASSYNLRCYLFSCVTLRRAALRLSDVSNVTQIHPVTGYTHKPQQDSRTEVKEMLISQS